MQKTRESKRAAVVFRTERGSGADAVRRLGRERSCNARLANRSRSKGDAAWKQPLIHLLVAP